MSRPAMPLPPLIEALRGLAEVAPDSDRAREEVAAALGPVAERLGLAGIRLELAAADPLPALTIGWGTLADDASGGETPITDVAGSPVGRVWAEGPESDGDTAAHAVETAVRAARDTLRADRAEEHLAALDAALSGISGAVSVDVVLELIVDRVRKLADAQYAALGIVGDDGMLERFITSGIDAESRRRIGSLPRGHGILGLLIRESRSIRIPDIAADPRRYGFPPHHPPMHSFLGVPVKVRGESVGNLYLTNKQGRSEFSAADQELVERFALHAGIAIQGARLAEQVQQLMLIEERERIGADLHDGVIQRIYGVNLSLDEVPELVTSDPEEAARRVESAIEGLNATIAEIREFIFILRPPGSVAGLTPSLRALAAEVRLQTGLTIDFTGEDVLPMRAEHIRELLSIAREGLSNAARHANARVATLSVRQDGPTLRLEVADDGRGFDPDAVRPEGHHGMVNMRRRADRLGGTLEVASRPGAGTRIIVVLPLDSGRAKVSEGLAGHERSGQAG